MLGTGWKLFLAQYGFSTCVIDKVVVYEKYITDKVVDIVNQICEYVQYLFIFFVFL